MSELSDERIRELLQADEMPDTSRMAPVNFELFVMVLQKRLAEERAANEYLRRRLDDARATLRATVRHLQDQPDLGLPLGVNVGEGAARVIREFRDEHRHCWSDDRHREKIRAVRELLEAEKAEHASTRNAAEGIKVAFEGLDRQLTEWRSRAERAEVRAEIAEGLTPEEVAAFRDGLIPATGDPVDDVRALAKIVLVREKEREAQEAVTLQQVERAERAEAERDEANERREQAENDGAVWLTRIDQLVAENAELRRRIALAEKCIEWARDGIDRPSSSVAMVLHQSVPDWVAEMQRRLDAIDWTPDAAAMASDTTS